MLAPVGHFFDVKEIVWPKGEVRGGIACFDSGKVHAHEVRLAVFTLDHFVTRHLGRHDVRTLCQAAARPKQVANRHAGLEWIGSGREHAAVDADELSGRSEARLQLELLQQRVDDGATIRGQQLLALVFVEGRFRLFRHWQ